MLCTSHQPDRDQHPPWPPPRAPKRARPTAQRCMAGRLRRQMPEGDFRRRRRGSNPGWRAQEEEDDGGGQPTSTRAMAESLRRLANSGAYGALQERLDSWQGDFHANSSNENLSHCCELIERTSKVQNQLLNMMSNKTNQGGPTASAKSRLLPFQSNVAVSPGVSPNTSLTLIRETAQKERQLQDLCARHMREVGSLESELRSTRQSLSNAKQRLKNMADELEASKTNSASTYLASEEEILQLRADLQAACEEAEVNRREREDSERQARHLQAEMATLQQEKARLLERMSGWLSMPCHERSAPPRRRASPTPSSSPPRWASPVRSSSALRHHMATCPRHSTASCHARLPERFKSASRGGRLDAQSRPTPLLLRHRSDA
ncbi:mitochondria-eating protein-like isoform X1 [Lethenteron reissneri]|uniref:mitochondria-eating protein-like isoform X1 n=2 Tax=Lethenteron reissneri TaxID=7753 RepID=UPI002AB7A731|nr:mitochondria-eating protein-like isoform X1 [Lethenteron reissneri]